MRRARPPLVALLLGVAGGLAPARADDDALPLLRLDGDDVVVRTSARGVPGTWRVRDADGDGVVHVVGPGVVLDLTGVVLEGAAPGEAPEAHAGLGIVVEGAAGVTVRGGTVRGFRVGLRATDAPGLVVDGLDASGNRRDRLRSTPDREDGADWLWPHENDDGAWERRWGAGLSLVRCEGAAVRRCRVGEGQNGLLLARSDHAVVEANDFSGNSGWGIALWRTCDGTFARNRCDFCVRGTSHGVYARGQDSAGFLVFEQSSRNTFTGNSATHGGDGFFLYAGHEVLKRTGVGGCDDNVVAHNDFSHAVANGIEATFSSGNRFDHNRLDDCEHGVWAGYSERTVVTGNLVRGCAHGVSVEHGRENRFVGNHLEACGVGVHLWWDEDAELAATPWGRAHELASARNVLEANRVRGGGDAFLLDGDEGARLVGNDVDGAARGLVLRGATAGTVLRGNRFRTTGVAVDNGTPRPVDAAADAWPLPRGADPEAPRLVGPGKPGAAAGRFLDPWASSPFAAGPTRSTAFLPADAPRGRDRIVVGPYGPLDPRRAAVTPAEVEPAPRARLRVVGAGLGFRVEGLPAGVVAMPASGTAPATVELATAGPGPTLRPFTATVRVGDASFPVRGTLTALAWTVTVAPWDGDPRTDAGAFARATGGPAAVTFDAPALDFATAGAFRDGLPRDRFVTRATTTVDMPAGRYGLRVTSDDGVRVVLDGRTVLEDWTWHAPKEDGVEVELPAGPHTLVVEHFELDGWAVLSLRVEPVTPVR